MRGERARYTNMLDRRLALTDIRVKPNECLQTDFPLNAAEEKFNTNSTFPAQNSQINL